MLLELLTILFMAAPVLGFFWACYPCCPCPILFSDTFDRANSTNIGSDWTETAGDWSIASNKLRTSDASAITICNTSGVAGNTYLSFLAKSSSDGDEVRGIINYTDSSNYDYVQIAFGAAFSVLKLFTRVAGADTEIESANIAGVFTGDEISVVICANATMVKATCSGSLSRGVYGITANNGTGAGLATGALTGNADFDSFSLRQHSSVGAGCPTCELCTSCKNSVAEKEYEVVIAGIANGSCVSCTTWNGTHIVTKDTSTIVCDRRKVSVNACTYIISATFYAYSALRLSFAGAGSLGDGISVKFGDDTCITMCWCAFGKSYTLPIDETTDGDGYCLLNGLDLPVTDCGNQGTAPAGVSPFTTCDMTGATCVVTAL